MARRSRTNLKRDGKVLVQSSVIRNQSTLLQQTAIQARDATRGVILYVDGAVSPYGDMLDKGKVPGKGQDWIGWFSNTAYNKVAVWIEAINNGNRTNLRSARRTVEASSKDTLARQTAYLRNIRRTSR